MFHQAKEAPIDPQSDSSPQPARPLRGLLIAQFCGAFNDNAWKFMVALLGIRAVTSTLAPGQDLETASQTQTTLAMVVFTLPLVLTSFVAGFFADRLSKRTVIITMKGWKFCSWPAPPSPCCRIPREAPGPS